MFVFHDKVTILQWFYIDCAKFDLLVHILKGGVNN